MTETLSHHYVCKWILPDKLDLSTTNICVTFTAGYIIVTNYTVWDKPLPKLWVQRASPSWTHSHHISVKCRGCPSTLWMMTQAADGHGEGRWGHEQLHCRSNDCTPAQVNRIYVLLNDEYVSEHRQTSGILLPILAALSFDLHLREYVLFHTRTAFLLPALGYGTPCHHIYGGTWTTDISRMHWNDTCLGYSRPRHIMTNLLSCASEAYSLNYLPLLLLLL